MATKRSAGVLLFRDGSAGDTEFLNWMVVIGAVGDAKASYTAYMPDFVATGWGFVSWRSL